MGEVYRAPDPRLGREVAIKVLPDSVASDPARLQRFEQEARAVAALSHANILAIAAYNLYLKGRYFWERRNQHFFKLALEHFERAIGEDPDYALAHSGVADYNARPSWQLTISNGFRVPGTSPRSKQTARK